MTQTSRRSASRSINNYNNMRSRTLAILACMAVMMARGQAFHVTAKTGFQHQAQPLLSTQLAARQNQNRRLSQTAAYYSSTADPPLTDKVPANFGSRMRNLVLRQQQVELEQLSQQQTPATKKSKHNPAKPSFVEEAVSLKEYKQLVADEHERLVVVRFYAKWCRACKAVEPLFYRMAHAMPDVKFVEVPVLEENANLHQGLGVPALPFAHIYSPTAGLVEELRMAKKEFKTFQRVVESYREGQCTDLELDPETGMFSSPYYQKDKEEEPRQRS